MPVIIDGTLGVNAAAVTTTNWNPTNLTIPGNSTIGDAAADTLTVNATPTFTNGVSLVSQSGASPAYAALALKTFTASQNAHPLIHTFRAGGTEASPTASSGTLLRQIMYGHNGSAFIEGAQIFAYQESAWSVGSTPAGMQFFTNDGTTNAVRLTITGTGNVGIGATTPAAKLDVFGNIRFGRTGAYYSILTQNQNEVWIGQTNLGTENPGSSSDYFFGINPRMGADRVLSIEARTADGAGSIWFKAGSGAYSTGAPIRMRLNGTNGALSINTTDTNKKLVVNGGIALSAGDGASYSYIDTADGTASISDARFMLRNGTDTHSALRIVLNSSSFMSMDAVQASNTAITKDMLLQVNGGGLGVGVGSITSPAKLEVNGIVRVRSSNEIISSITDGHISIGAHNHSSGWGVSGGMAARTGDDIWAFGSNGTGFFFGVGSISSNTFGSVWQTNTGNTDRTLEVWRGVRFPASQNASSDPNTLDDYEEGTFQATLGGSGNTYTQSVQTGQYTKVGNVVTVMMQISWSARSGSNQLTIALPFPVYGTRGGLSIGMITGSTLISASQIVYAQVDGGYSYLNLRYSNNGSSWTPFTPANMGASGEIQIAGSYLTN